MDLKIRRIFFYCLIAVFVLLGAYLVITAQGWVLDFKSMKIVETGALFLKYSPTDALVEINGERSNASPGLLSSGVFISKLVPGEYKVKVEKTNYLPWEKTFKVDEALVAAASQIKLWPEEWPMREVATSSISDFWLTGSGAVFQLSDKTLRLNNVALRGRNVILSDQNSSIFVTSNDKNYFFTDLTNPKAAVSITNILSQTTSTPIAPKKFFIHPFSDSKIIITSEDTLYSLDLRKMSLDKIIETGKIVNSALSDNDVFLEDEKGILTIFNLILQTATTANSNFPLETSMKVSPSGSFMFFMKKDGGLAIYSRSGTASSTVFEGAANVFVSSDDRRIALLSQENELSLVALADYYTDGEVESGDRWTIHSGNGPVRDFEWLSDAPGYGLVLSGDKLIIAELDRRDPKNAYTVTDGVKKFYIQGTNVYILKSDGTLWEASLK